MRTTLNLPENVHEAARSLASAKQISLGDALAELARRGLGAGVGIRTDNGFPCFDFAEDAPSITLEQTLVAEDDS